MKHLGDVCRINGAEIEPVDILCGGAPCQDLSVAGKRKGLKHEGKGDDETTRSGLFMEQLRIAKEMRDADRKMGRADGHLRPRYLVYENVPGLFSSNAGDDFRCVLEEIAKVVKEDTIIPRLEGGAKWTPCGIIMGDGFSIAWTSHDARYYGVPQRRRRVCVLADFNGESAPKICFELLGEATYREAKQIIGDIGSESQSEVQSVSESLPRDFEQEREKGETVTTGASGSIDPSSYTLKIRGGV